MKKHSQYTALIRNVILIALLLFSFSHASPTKVAHVKQLESYLIWLKTSFGRIDKNYQTWDASQTRNWFIETGRKKKEFGNKFGNNSNEYIQKFKRLCFSAFYDISVGIGELETYGSQLTLGTPDMEMAKQIREYVVEDIRKADQSIKECKK